MPNCHSDLYHAKMMNSITDAEDITLAEQWVTDYVLPFFPMESNSVSQCRGSHAQDLPV